MSGSVDKMLRTAKAQAKAGALAEAEALYRQVLTRFAGNKRAQAGLAELAQMRAQAPVAPPRPLVEDLLALQRAGRHRDLAARAAQALAQFPRAPALLDLRAAALMALGDAAGAAVLYRELAQILPDHADTRGNLGNALMASGDAEGAIAQFEQLLALRPTDAVAQNNLGNALVSLNRQAEARAHYEAAVAVAPDFALARLSLGALLAAQGEVAAAREQFEAALPLAPKDARLRRELARVLIAQGEFAAARAHLDSALDCAPDFAEALVLRAQITELAPADPLLARIEGLLASSAPTDRQRAALHIALGDALAKLGTPEQAFEQWRKGNALRKSLIGYDIAQDRALFAQIKDAFSAPPPPIPDPRPAGPEPIFILGMPRSGSTLVEQIVSAHPQVAAGGEIDDLDSALAGLDWSDPAVLMREGPAIRDAYRARLARVGGDARFVTDKMPANFRWIGAIRALFPNARLIHARRDPRAVLFSIFRIDFTSDGLGYACDLGDLVAYHGLYADLMAHWHALFPGAILDLDYEALTETPEDQIPALIAGLGLPWDAACLRPQDNARAVNTASNQQVRQPIYRGSSQGWRRYQAALGDVFDALPGA